MGGVGTAGAAAGAAGAGAAAGAGVTAGAAGGAIAGGIGTTPGVGAAGSPPRSCTGVGWTGSWNVTRLRLAGGVVESTCATGCSPPSPAPGCAGGSPPSPAAGVAGCGWGVSVAAWLRVTAAMTWAKCGRRDRASAMLSVPFLYFHTKL